MMFTKDGKFIKSCGETGYGPARCTSFSAIARDPATGNIYIADRGNQRIDIFGQRGQSIS